VAGGLFVLPSVFILIALSWLYLAYGEVPAIAGLLYGIKPAVVAIVLAAAWRIGSRALKHPALWAISVAAFLAIGVFGVPFPYVVLAAALAGALGGRFAPQVFRSGGAHGAAAHHYGPAIIDDDTPTPEHARYRPGRLLGVATAFLALWATALGALALAFGWQGTLTQMGWFFTKAALLTFGGAYAVLPYVYQAAFEHHQWLTATQMIDGLALGETTPGPLIIVVAFVGFVGAGVAGALVASFFTFLPSFLFIFAGAPLVEATHGNLRFTAPLTGITAAVVGVVVSLAVFFARHVFLVNGAADWASIVLAAAALAALMRFKAGLIPVILASGVAGLCYRLLLA